MSSKLTVIVLALCLLASLANAERVEVGPTTEDLAVTVEESTDLRTVVRFEIGAFSKDPVSIGGDLYYSLSAGTENILLNKGEPALPRICRSIIIPDDARMTARVISSSYVDYPDLPVAPSKGNLPRTVNPKDVPFEFGPVYDVDAWYPGEVVGLREPFILRDYRGTVVECHAFQYNPVTQTVRVYTSVTVEIVRDGPGEINVLSKSKRAQSLIPDFDLIYKRRFINYGLQADKYTPVVEQGDMLIITYDDFHAAMEPFIAWKMQKGIRTWIVDISEIGNNGPSIADFIRDFYDADSTNLAFVLLVGDHAQVNKPVGGGLSDPVYAKVAGSDDYPDIFIGRFSAETVTEVETQVDRTIVYESNPPSGDWYHIGFGIASDDDGTGQGGEHDWEHMDLIRDDLLNFTYTSVDRLYENEYATSADVSAALNEGRGIGNYTGHGSPTSWSTTAFSNSHVNALTNDYKLPFIISVACNNGQFDIYTCFAETWLRATNGTAATGAIGFYGSMISQSWSPPMDAQDEAVDLLCATEKYTFGGLCFNGACKMIDMNGSEGADEYDAWTIFGDPSVMVWTDTPAAMTVDHDSILIFGASESQVQISGVPGALCALYADGVLFGSGYADGSGLAVVPINDDLPIGQNVTLTVTAFNREPYIAAIEVVAPQGPYVVYDDNTVNDAVGGNGNGAIDYGESIVLGMQLKNVGPDDAVDVQAVIATSDPYITLADDSATFGDIPGDDGLVYVADAFAFDVSQDVPDSHRIDFTVTVTESSRDSIWVSDFSVTAHGPVLEYVSVLIDDEMGNNNGVFDPGEAVSVTVALFNGGSGQADGVAAMLSSADPYVTISDASGNFGDILPGAGGDNSLDGFAASASSSCTRGHEAAFTLTVSAARGYEAVLGFSVTIGDRVAFFTDDFSTDQGWSGLGGSGEWTIGPATGGAGSDSYGGADPAMDHSPTGDNGVLGNDLTPEDGGDYAAGLGENYWVTSPEIDCADFNGVQLGFYRWLGVEGGYDHALLQVFDGSVWTTLFENDETVDESSWNEQVYDVSSYADSNETFQIRFGIGPTDGAWNYCGWNIDDLYLKGYGERVSAELAFGSPMLCDSLIPGDAAAETLWVYNLSTEATLRVRFSVDADWLSCDEALQYVNPEDSLGFSVMVTTAGILPGDYEGHLAYECNDYSHPYDTVPVLLHLYAPVMEIVTESLSDTLLQGTSSIQEMVILNTGPGRLEFRAGCQMFDSSPAMMSRLPAPVSSVRMPAGVRAAGDDRSDMMETYFEAVDRGTGGPDAFGYSWIDSDEPGGPEYSWVDISSVGTTVSLTDDTASVAIPLGFSFPFYDASYSDIYIGSNGILTFGTGSGARTNDAVPDTSAPNNLIAMWWDDLDPSEGGQVYYYADPSGERFIVSFEEIRNYIPGGGTGSLTFQAILYSEGEIVFQYGEMDPGDDMDGLTGATIGIENSTGEDGLEVVYNAPYVHSGLAVLFDAERWLSVEPAAGVIEPYSSDTLTVSFDASDLETGEYSGQVVVASNDPVTPSQPVPVSLFVQYYVCGDASGDEAINVNDAVYIINYVFKGGPPPQPLASGDADGSGAINISDAIYIISYIFRGGPPPEC